MRIIDDETVLAVLDMPACVDAMDAAFREYANGVALNHPRQRYKVNSGDAPGYMANMLPGAVPSAGVAAMRYQSLIVSERVVDGKRRMEWDYPNDRSWGLVQLYSLETGEPLAFIQDFSLSALRVGATTGVAVRALAQQDASVVGLFGTGFQAGPNLQATCAVRSIRIVHVYSPNREHRERFAKEMSAMLELDVIAVSDPADVIRGAHVVLTMTNSSEPVFDGTTLSPGQLVVSISNSDHVHKRHEVDDATMLRSCPIVVNHLPTLRDNNQRELLDLIDAGKISASNVVEIGDVLIGKAKGRQSPDDIIYYKANSGMGIQFAAAGAAILKECDRRNLGHVVPSAWFGADVSIWRERGLLPSA